MIGISFISVELLLQKIITWIKEQDSLSDFIQSNDLFDSVEPYFIRCYTKVMIYLIV